MSVYMNATNANFFSHANRKTSSLMQRKLTGGREQIYESHNTLRTTMSSTNNNRIFSAK